MSQADSRDTTNPSQLSIWALFADPFVAAAFRRAERDTGSVFAIPAPVPGRLIGGAAVAAPSEAGEPVALLAVPG
jgi:hypothetical protein